MWRAVCLAILLGLVAPGASAADVRVPGPWEVCRGERGPAGPRLSDCRPVDGFIDPQGKEQWLRATVRPPPTAGAQVLYVAGVASSEAWLNGAFVGANGRPAATAAAETPGLYVFDAPLPKGAWQAGDNVLVLHMSSFHGGLRLTAPVGVWIGPPGADLSLPILAGTFVAAGALLAALFGFGAIWAVRRTGSSLTLGAMAGVAALQAAVESARSLFNYPYPLHALRLIAILVLSGAFALLLVHHAASRFAPRRHGVFMGLGAATVVGCAFLPGFDAKSGMAIVGAALLAAVAAALGARAGRPGAWPTLACLGAFAVVAVAAPFLVLDLSMFVLAAALTLPLLVAEVVRLGREDRAREAALTRAASQPERLTVTSTRGVELVPLRDIVAILGADDYAELRLRGGRSLLHAARLDRLEAELPSGFVRVHRSVIVNVAHVERLERDAHRWRLHMDEGPPVPVSRSRLATVREALDEPSPPLRATA